MHRERVTRKEADAENSGGRRQERGCWDGGRELGKEERRAGKEGSSLVQRPGGKEAEGRKRGNSEMNMYIWADPGKDHGHKNMLRDYLGDVLSNMHAPVLRHGLVHLLHTNNYLLLQIWAVRET
jgi:hypothetical protein